MKKPRWVVKFREKRKKIKVKTWWLVILLVILLGVDATLLRMDHIRMTELRDAVLAADAAEDNETLASVLDELREFVRGNVVINITEENGAQVVQFGTGPFYLEHQYLKAANAALAAAEAELKSDANPNGNIYAAAADVCRPQAIANGWLWTDARYINCMMGEISKYPAAEELQTQVVASLPSTELYRHNYASPVWAPTLTGFAILATLVVIVVIFIRFIIWVILRLSLFFL